MSNIPTRGPQCNHIHRRQFVSDLGLGFAGLAMGSMLHWDGVGRADAPRAHAGPDGRPHFAPKARSVIWIFLSGGVSHLETFDPKPALNRYAGKTYSEAPFPNPQRSPLFLLRSRSVVGMDRDLYVKIFPLQVGSRRYGQNGMDVSDWLPNLAGCVDDIAFVRSMYTTDNDHAAEFQMHHGRHALDEKQPSIGSWIHYGLGTLNDNLPKFVFLGQYRDTRVRENFAADYLGPQHNGIELSLDPNNPLPFGTRGRGVLPREQQNQFEFVNELNRIAAAQHPEDEQLQARIRSYELAFRMQRSVPEALDLNRETPEMHRLYGIDNPTTAVYGRRLLAARRLAERGVRFNLVYLSDYGEWDSHQDLRGNHSRSCARIDKPVAGLLKDLKRSGLSDDVLVVFCTEFGRTPALESRAGLANPTGRDHHPHGFTVWLAGAGIRPGVIHGATDELGFHAIEHPHYVTDIHATVLHLLGLDPHRLAIPGRQRLEIDYGTPIRQIMA
ncbi:MAG: DUF1501 domain-containing protein [Planctomycetes bacterium]|nr:DUF1501 domain-containing protein [Planctomycetota bacterium]